MDTTESTMTTNVVNDSNDHPNVDSSSSMTNSTDEPPSSPPPASNDTDNNNDKGNENQPNQGEPTIPPTEDVAVTAAAATTTTNEEEQDDDEDAAVTTSNYLLEHQEYAMSLDVAYQSLESVRRLNVQVEFNGTNHKNVDPNQCIPCLREFYHKQQQLAATATANAENDTTEDGDDTQKSSSKLGKWISNRRQQQQEKQLQLQEPLKKKIGQACLACGTPVCKNLHRSKEFAKMMQNITICLDCVALFRTDRILDEMLEQYSSSSSNNNNNSNNDDYYFSNEYKEWRHQQQKSFVNRILEVYDRTVLILKYSLQYIPEVAAALEGNTTRHNMVGLGSSATGMVAGGLGVAAACTILTPVGPPLLVASILFGSGATAVTAGSEAVNYRCEPNKMADRILTLYTLMESIYHVPSELSMRQVQVMMELDKEKAAAAAAASATATRNAAIVVAKEEDNATKGEEGEEKENAGGGEDTSSEAAVVTNDEEETVATMATEDDEKETADSADATTMTTASKPGIGSSWRARLQRQRAGGAGAGSSQDGSSSPKNNNTQGGSTTSIITPTHSFQSKDQSTLHWTRTAMNGLKPLTAGALSAISIVTEARELKNTVAKIRAGNPCEKAERLRSIFDECVLSVKVSKKNAASTASSSSSQDGNAEDEPPPPQQVYRIPRTEDLSLQLELSLKQFQNQQDELDKFLYEKKLREKMEAEAAAAAAAAERAANPPPVVPAGEEQANFLVNAMIQQKQKLLPQQQDNNNTNDNQQQNNSPAQQQRRPLGWRLKRVLNRNTTPAAASTDSGNKENGSDNNNNNDNSNTTEKVNDNAADAVVVAANDDGDKDVDPKDVNPATVLDDSSSPVAAAAEDADKAMVEATPGPKQVSV